MSETIHNKRIQISDDERLAHIEATHRQDMALFQVRRDRNELRRHLLQSYGGRCAISGTAVSEVLDVALIVPATHDQAYRPDNALLLRSDLQTLFLERLIAIDSATMTVVLSPRLRQSSYAELEGKPLLQPFHLRDCPDPAALDLHRSWLQTTPTRATAASLAAQTAPEPEPLRTPQPQLPEREARALQNASLLPLHDLTLQNKSCVNNISFHPREKVLAVACWDGLIRIWRPDDACLVNTLNGGIGEVNSISFSPDGRHIVSGGRNRDVQIWHYEEGTLLHRLSGHEGAVFSVSYSPDGSLIASGSWDRTVRLWRASDGRSLRVLNNHRGAVNSVAFSPDGSCIASASHDCSIRIWNVADGRLLHVLTGHSDAVFSIAYSPDGRFLASASCDHSLRIWNVSDGSLLQILAGHTGAVFALAYSPGGDMLASGDYDRTVRLWRCSDGTLLHEAHQHLEGITTLAYAPNSWRLASGSFDATVRFWNSDFA